jgi:Mg/Co/Ni transporter MgtE
VTALDEAVPTCELGEQVGAVRRRLGETTLTCVVVNDRRVVAGVLQHLDTIDPEDPRPVSQVMRPGPATIRPSEDLKAVRQRMSTHHIQHLLVTTPEGELLGLLRAE